MRWSTRRPNGDSVHYETGSRAEEMIGDLRVVVVPTVVTTVDSLGRPKARLRERFALALATATGGTFERPDPAASGQWKPQSTFVLKELRHPATGTAPPVESALIPDTTLPIPPLQFDSSGALVIRPSPSSSQRDFDFLIGKWKLRNRNLKSRLTNSTEWITFESQVEMHQILNGLGNIDRYTDSSTGRPFEGVALRLFNPATRLWSIYWADSNTGTLDPPVVGSFANQVGHFFTRHSYKGRKIIMVFRWDLRNPQFPVWSQAFSTDVGN
jgi:hypothetical protein